MPVILGTSSTEKKKKKKKSDAIPVTGHGAGRMEDSHRKKRKIGEKKLEIMEEN
jgi:hypothetical protein